MPMPRWVFQNGEYVLMDGSEILDVCTEVAILYDNETKVLLKHGSKERIEALAKKTRDKFIAAGHQNCADDIRILYLPAGHAASAETINKCMDITGYLEVFLKAQGVT